jgi:hypothetical protein
MRTLIVLLLAVLLLIVACEEQKCTDCGDYNFPYNEQFFQIVSIDDGFLFAGVRQKFMPPAQLSDLYFVRTQVDGSQRWERSVSVEDCRRVAVQTSTEGFLAAGALGFGDAEVVLVRLDTLGNELSRFWSNTFPLRDPNICATADGGFVIAGLTESTPRLLRFFRIDAQGTSSHLRDMIVSEIYGNLVEDLVQCADGGFAALTANNLYRISASGDSLWTAYIWMFEVQVHGYRVSQADSAQLIVAASWKDLYDSSQDVALFHVDSVGRTRQIFIYTVQTEETPTALAVLGDQGCIVAGSTLTGAPGHGLLLRQTAQGSLLWQQHYTRSSQHDILRAVAQTSDGGFMAAGYTESNRENGGTDAWIVETDASGVLQWQQTYGQ